MCAQWVSLLHTVGAQLGMFLQVFDFTQKAHTLWSWGLVGLAVHQGGNQASSCLSKLSNRFCPRVLVGSEGERVNCADLSVWKLPAAIHPPTQPHRVQCNGRGSNKQDNGLQLTESKQVAIHQLKAGYPCSPGRHAVWLQSQRLPPAAPPPVLLSHRLQPAPGPSHMLCTQSSVLLLWLPRADPPPDLPTRFLTYCSQYCAEVTMNFIGMMSSGPLIGFP